MTQAGGEPDLEQPAQKQPDPGHQADRLFSGPWLGHGVRRLDLGGLCFHQRDDVIDHPRVLDMMIGDARQIDHVLARAAAGERSEEHTSELQSLMRISYAVFCLKKKKQHSHKTSYTVMHTQQTKNTQTTRI